MQRNEAQPTVIGVVRELARSQIVVGTWRACMGMERSRWAHRRTRDVCARHRGPSEQHSRGDEPDSGPHGGSNDQDERVMRIARCRPRALDVASVVLVCNCTGSCRVTHESQDKVYSNAPQL